MPVITNLDCDSEWCACPACGARMRRPAGWSEDRLRHVCQPPRPGLGDRVASALSAVGITEDRVQAAASKVGVKDCGCGRRKARLNDLGRRLGIG